MGEREEESEEVRGAPFFFFLLEGGGGGVPRRRRGRGKGAGGIFVGRGGAKYFFSGAEIPTKVLLRADLVLAKDLKFDISLTSYRIENPEIQKIGET